MNAFTMSPTKWIEGVNAIGIVTKAGRYGGTYAHSDIALEFASWVSAVRRSILYSVIMISIHMETSPASGLYGQRS